jgi:hypothetical protein
LRDGGRRGERAKAVGVTAADAAKLMYQRRVKRLPVVDSAGQLCRHREPYRSTERLTRPDSSWGVTWISPDGHPRDIGRAVGYATRAEAEAVGREYLSEHGGAYQVHGS